MVTYSRAHQNACPAVHTLTDATREAILSKAARVAQEAQAVENKQREDDETERKAAEKLARDAAAAAATANEAQAAENKQREDAETKHKAAVKLALDTANESPDTLRKRKAARAAAEKRSRITTGIAKTAQAALATVHATCTKSSKDVASAQQPIKAAEKAKTKADEVHKVSVVQLADLEKGVADANSRLTAAVKRKAAET
jgi:hypothetical protein